MARNMEDTANNNKSLISGENSDVLTGKDFLEILSAREKEFFKPVQEGISCIIDLIKNENEALKEENRSFKRETELLIEEIDGFKNEVDLLREKLKNFSESEGTEEITEKIEKLEREKELLKAENYDFKKEIYVLNEKIKYLSVPEDFELAREEMKFLKEENEKLKEQLSLLPGKAESISQVLLDNAKNLSILQRDNKRITEDSRVLNKMREDLEKENQELISVIEQMRRKTAEIDPDFMEQGKDNSGGDGNNSNMDDSQKPWWKPFG